MNNLNICYVLDCSQSMMNMPKEGLTVFLDSIKKIENDCNIQIVEFGTTVKYSLSSINALDFKWKNKKWNCSMGRTALYDAIVVAILCAKPTGLITIITDGKENESWCGKLTAVTLARKYRQHQHKHGIIRIIGPGTKEELENILDGEVDSVFPLDEENVHKSLTNCLSSTEYHNNTQESLNTFNY